MAISKQKTSLFFRLSISVTVFGALFKFISWPLIILGALGMVIFYGIQFYQKENRFALDYCRLLLIVSFAFNYVFSILNFQYGNILTIVTKAALIAFLALYIKKMLLSLQDNSNLLLHSLGRENLSFILADLATVYIVVASLFKILRWELGIINANVLLIIGLLSALISILASPKSLSNQDTP